MREKIGLFAGKNEISKYAFEKLSKKNNVVVFSFSSSKPDIPSIHYIKPGNIKNFLIIFKKEKIHKIALVGKVEASEIFSNNFHKSGKKFLQNINIWQSETILKQITSLLKENEINVMPLTEIFKENIAETKIYSKRRPDKREMEDIKSGFETGEKLIKYRIGQSLAVKNGMILSVEGIEGTDKMIERTGKFCSDFVIIKIAGKGKDTRFDLPTVGPKTIKAINKAKGKTLAVEAGKTIIINKKLTISLCNNFKISFIGI